MLSYFIAAYIVMSVIGYLLIRSDKQAARTDRLRVSERSIVLHAFLFGWPGVFFGMKYFRHKIYKTLFKLQVKAAAFLNVLVALMFFLQSNHAWKFF